MPPSTACLGRSLQVQFDAKYTPDLEERSLVLYLCVALVLLLGI